MTVDKCRILKLQNIEDFRGSISVLEGKKDLPFEIKRVFYIYDVPSGQNRGSHAHKTLEQFVICLSGSFDIYVNDGVTKKTFHMDRAWEGLYIPPMIWSSENNFASNSLCLVVVSDYYNEDDYLRNYGEFVRIKESSE